MKPEDIKAAGVLITANEERTRKIAAIYSILKFMSSAPRDREDDGFNGAVAITTSAGSTTVQFHNRDLAGALFNLALDELVRQRASVDKQLGDMGVETSASSLNLPKSKV